MIGLAGWYAITTVTLHETATIRVFGQYAVTASVVKIGEPLMVEA